MKKLSKNDQNEILGAVTSVLNGYGWSIGDDNYFCSACKGPVTGVPKFCPNCGVDLLDYELEEVTNPDRDLWEAIEAALEIYDKIMIGKSNIKSSDSH
jgi:hypothetical protein